MAVAILIGICVGFVGFLTLYFALRLIRKQPDSPIMKLALTGLGAVLISLIVLVVALIACAKTAHDVLLPFGAAEVVTLIAATIGCVIYKNRTVKKKE